MTEPRQLRYRAKNPEKVKGWKRAYYARHRERILAERAKKAEEFAAYMREYRLRPEAAEKIKKKSAAWRAAHPGYQAAWMHAHPEQSRIWCRVRRERRRGAPVSEQIDPAYIYARDQGICHICGLKVKRKEASLDHLIPLSKGGNHTEENVALAHRRCNSRRGAGRLPGQLRLFG